MDTEILYNERLGQGYYRLGLVWPEAQAAAGPGQFVMLKVSGCDAPLLRRPFSIYNQLDSEAPGPASGQGRIEILYKVVGSGTALLAALSPGTKLDVLGPLGNGFNVEAGDRNEPLLMVAGGIGIAALYMLGARSEAAPKKLLFGGRAKADAVLVEGFSGLAQIDVQIATEDGSVGTRGLVTELLEKEIKPETVVYACGPVAMLKAVHRVAASNSSTAYVSLEGTMACGIGVCLGCAVAASRGGYAMVCSEGPVFDSKDIDWERV